MIIIDNLLLYYYVIYTLNCFTIEFFYGEAEKGKDVKNAKVSGIDVVLEAK